MKQQTEIKSFYEKLSDFQQEDLGLQKTKSAHQYKYAPLDDIMHVLTPLLHKHRLLIVHQTTSNDVGDEHVVTKLIDIDSDMMSQCKTKIQYGIKIGSMNPVMVIGAQITYIRRYHVVTLLNLTTEEDTDVNPTSSSKAKVQAVLKNGPDYLKIFQNQISKGKDAASLKKSLENYKTKMEADIYEQVLKLIETNSKK